VEYFQQQSPTFAYTPLLLVQTNVCIFKMRITWHYRSEDHRAMIESRMVFEENIAPAPTAQQARGLADWLRTCVGLVVPTGATESSGDTLRQRIHDEHRPAPLWREAQCLEDEVRRHFRHEIKHIMRQGPLGTDFVLCAVGRMAEDILRAEDGALRDLQLADQWIEYARRILPGL
jgi:hypothetical protein